MAVLLGVLIYFLALGCMLSLVGATRQARQRARLRQVALDEAPGAGAMVSSSRAQHPSVPAKGLARSQTPQSQTQLGSGR